MRRIILPVLIITILLPSVTIAKSRRWKRTRYELVGGLGTATFMGELGGRGAATHMMGDFNFTSQRALMSAGMRYKLLEPLALKGTLSLGWLSGDDAKCDDIYRLDRNLSFKSHLLEFAVQAEFSIIKEPVSHRYSLRRRRKFSLKNIKINTYIFAGISGFWFNPKGLDEVANGGTGEWVSLQPLHTEGQGYIPSREPYSRVQMAFPFGIGFKYNLNRRISIGAEFGARYTLTDYLDDVSTSYIDNDWLKRNNPLAARMADKSLISEQPVKLINGKPYLYPAGDQRGDSKYNDFYFFSLVTVAYKLRTGRNGLPKF